jgi:CRP/FNR family transcriptional regulator, cyclic AMP receptor protein
VTLVRPDEPELTVGGHFLARLPLFAGLPEEELARLTPLMRPFAVAAGTTLFREGDPAGSMYAIEHGLLEAATHLPGERDLRLATIGAGELLGELSLVNGGTRTATVRVLEDTSGYTIDQRAFELVRSDLRPGALELTRRLGQVAVARMRRAYGSLAERLGGEAEVGGPVGPAGIGEVDPERDELSYLARILFFRDFQPGEIETVLVGLRRLAVPRGAVLRDHGERQDALFLVLRGAIEVTIRGGRQAARVLLAGPGRAAGHLGVLDEAPSIGLCRARERAVVLEVRRERIADLELSGRAEARRFTQALHEDVVRALQQAERPLARMAAHV